MRIQYDPEVDVLHISFRETTVTTREWEEGVTGEYDTQGRLVGIEILDASQRLGDVSALGPVALEGIGQSNP